MLTATITEAKNRLSALIDLVRAGQSVLILDRGVPVARLEPASTEGRQPGRLDRLERGGVVRRRARPLDVERLLVPGPALPAGSSVVEALIEERRSGR